MLWCFKTTPVQQIICSLNQEVSRIGTKEKRYKDSTIRKSLHVAKPTISSDILVGIDALTVEDVCGEYINGKKGEVS